jgi:allantoinase
MDIRVNNKEFPCVAEDDLVKALDALTDARKGKGDAPDGLVLFHAELEKHQHQNGHASQADPKEYSTFLESRPAQLELDALELILKMCKAYPNIQFHIVHLSAAEAVPRIKTARQEGIANLTVETCYHYLTLSSEDIPDNATQYKCCPPIRSEANRKQICQALLDGVIDYVVSDHSPCIPELKKGDFMSAWGGVSGLGLGLSLLWTEFSGKVELGRIMSWVSTIQAKQVALQSRKGSIAAGFDADLVIFDPEAEYTVDKVRLCLFCDSTRVLLMNQEHLLFKNKVSPYVGKTLKGVVKQTYLRGQLVWDGKRVTKCIGQTL